MSAGAVEPGISTHDSRPLRIALVHASDLGGGAERSVVGLHRSLRELGHSSTLYVGERRTDEPGVEAIPYVRGVPGSRRLARALERRFGWQDIYNPSFRALRKRIDGHFDVVHFNSLWGSAGFADIAALPAITGAVPGVITMRDNWLLTGHCAYFHACRNWLQGCGGCPDLTLAPALPRDGTRFNWKRKQRALRKSRIEIVAISESLKGDALASPILSGKHVSRIYNGIDLATFRPLMPDERMRLRAEFGFAPEDTVVLMAGQTVEGIRKGIATKYAVAALNQLDGRRPVHALVIGHSSTRVAELLRLPTVTLPFQDDPAQMARCFQASDLCLVTSEVEAFGRIAAEAQACATPVIAFGSGGIPEVVADGVGGAIVPRRDGAALFDALQRLVDDPEQRRRMGVAGCEYVRDRFDQEAVAGHYVDLYRQIIVRLGGARA